MKKLSYILNGLIDGVAPDIDINNICCDPKQCLGGDLLFLTNKKSIDEYLSILPKAAAIVSDCYIPLKTKAYITQNMRRAIAMAYARLYCNNLEKIKFIGITGTNGKSTTAIMLEKILVDQGYKVGLIGTGKIKIGDEILSPQYYSMTTPPPDLLYSSIGKMENMGVDVIVMEVSSHALDQGRVCAINFHIGIFTNLSEEHLDYHKSMKSYFKSKCMLFEKSEYILANNDDEYGKIVISNFQNAESCGQCNNSGVLISDICDCGFGGSRFTYKSNLDEVTVNINLPGIYNVYNAMMAMRAAQIMGASITDIKTSIEKINKIDGRYEIIQDKITVVIDYAHTTCAFHNLIKSLYSAKKIGQNLTIVFGCGGERDKSKRFAMGKVCEDYADRIIITSDNPRGENPLDIITDITCSMIKKHEIIVDRADAIKHAIISAADESIVAIIGKGPEKYTISNGSYSPFDEVEIVRNALRSRQA